MGHRWIFISIAAAHTPLLVTNSFEIQSIASWAHCPKLSNEESQMEILNWILSIGYSQMDILKLTEFQTLKWTESQSRYPASFKWKLFNLIR